MDRLHWFLLGLAAGLATVALSLLAAGESLFVRVEYRACECSRWGKERAFCTTCGCCREE